MRSNDETRRWPALAVGVATVAPFAPLIAIVATVAVYTVVDLHRQSNDGAGGLHWPVVLGVLIAGIVVWGLAALVVSLRSHVESASPRLHLSLVSYVASLRSAVMKLPPPDDDLSRRLIAKIDAELSAVEEILGEGGVQPPGDGAFVDEPGFGATWHLTSRTSSLSAFQLRSDWRSGVAYNQLFQRLHDIEVDLLLVCPEAVLIATALEDYARLEGSNIPRKDFLQHQIVLALRNLGVDPEALLQPIPLSVARRTNLSATVTATPRAEGNQHGSA